MVCKQRPQPEQKNKCNAKNEKSLNSAIANQTQGQVKQGQSASLRGENQVSGVEVRDCNEGSCSAAPMPNPEKWSHEAIDISENLQSLYVARL